LAGAAQLEAVGVEPEVAEFKNGVGHVYQAGGRPIFVISER